MAFTVVCDGSFLIHFASKKQVQGLANVFGRPVWISAMYGACWLQQ